MITYWVNAEHRHGLDRYLADRGRPLADRIEIRTYEELTPVVEVSCGPHIFSTLDQLGPRGKAAAGGLFDALAAALPGARLLNDPRRVRLRYDLLAALHRAGINEFKARRASEPHGDLRFPVFVREESDHFALTGLLRDRRSLSRALLGLRARGFRAASLLVIEFCDLADAGGWYHKAAAFKVGDAIVPAHLLTGRPWMLKWDEADRNESTMSGDLRYVTGNPHESWLRRVFALARVDYGRCDYGVGSTTLQAWEINLNPTIGLGPGPHHAPPLAPDVEALQEQSRVVHHGALQDAFRALDPGSPRDRVTVGIAPSLVAGLQAEVARAQRRRWAEGFLQRLYDRPAIGRPFRFFYSRFLPRA